MDPQSGYASNLDVDQMQADLAAQAAMYSSPPVYPDYQANLTQARASFGDYPAMMMAGAHQVGATASGAWMGTQNMFSQIGQYVMPPSYAPPARVSVGYYGQYAQQTGFLSGALAVAGINNAPLQVSPSRWGYTQASDFGERLGGGVAGISNMFLGMAMATPGAMAGRAAGQALGAGVLSSIGMKTGGMLGGFAGGMMAYQAADIFAESLAQRRQINAFLESSSFRYTAGGSPMSDPRLGGGLGMGERRQMVDYMRQLDISDPRMNMEDISGVMQGATSLGLFSGVRDMEDFRNKFKNIIDGVKVVARTLNTTLQEGLQVMKDLKSIAIDPSQMGNIAFQAASTGMATGRTAHEIVNFGLQGAELYRGTGIEMKIGYQANLMNLAAIRAGRDAGAISQEIISQAGGEEALAQRLTASGLSFMQSGAGRGYGAAFYKPGAGPYGFDKDAFVRNMTGENMSLENLYMKGMGNIGNLQNFLQYEAYQDKFMGEMGKTFGGDTTLPLASAAMAQAQWLAKGTGIDNKTALRLTLMRDFGQNGPSADAIIAMVEGGPEAYRRKMEAQKSAGTQRRIDDAMYSRGVGYMWNRMEDIGKAMIVDPVIRPFDTMIDNLKSWSIRTQEEMKGVYRWDARGIDFSGAAAAARGIGLPGSTEFRDVVSGVNLDEEMGGTTKSIIAGGAGIGVGLLASLATPMVGVGAGIATTAGVRAMLGFGESVGRRSYDSIKRLQKRYGLTGLVDERVSGADRDPNLPTLMDNGVTHAFLNTYVLEQEKTQAVLNSYRSKSEITAMEEKGIFKGASAAGTFFLRGVSEGKLDPRAMTRESMAGYMGISDADLLKSPTAQAQVYRELYAAQDLGFIMPNVIQGDIDLRTVGKELSDALYGKGMRAKATAFDAGTVELGKEVGVDFNRETALLFTQLQSETDPIRRRELKDSLKKAHTKYRTTTPPSGDWATVYAGVGGQIPISIETPGKTVAEELRILETAADKPLSDAGKAVIGAGRDINVLMDWMGKKDYLESIDVAAERGELSFLKGSVTAELAKAGVTHVLTKGFKGLPKEQEDAMKLTPAGTNLLAHKEVSDKLEKISDKAHANKKDADTDFLEQEMREQKIAPDIMGKLLKGTKESGGAVDLRQLFMGIMRQESVTQTGAVVPWNIPGPAGKGVELGSQADNDRTQLSINLEVLEALRSLSAMLKK